VKWFAFGSLPYVTFGFSFVPHLSVSNAKNHIFAQSQKDDPKRTGTT
jgi:hypothetical protein